MPERPPPVRSRRPHVSRSRLSWWWSAALVAVAFQLWGVYRVQPPPTDPAIPGLDKIGHLTAFGLPVLLITLAVHRTRRPESPTPSRRTSARLVAVVALVSLGHAVVSEVVQRAFYARRTGDPLDVLADAVGIGVGALVAWRLVRR